MTCSSRPTFAGFLLAALLAAGCGPGKGTVAGTVSHKDGKKVTTGSVTLIAADGLAYSASIQPDGSYVIPNVPAGSAKACVVSPNPSAVAPARQAERGGRRIDKGRSPRERAPVPVEAARSWFPIKDDLSDPQKSNLSVVVQGGKVPFDIVVE